MVLKMLPLGQSRPKESSGLARQPEQLPSGCLKIHGLCRENKWKSFEWRTGGLVL